MRTPVDATTYDNWEDVLPHRDDVLLEGIDIFKDYLVVSERSNGLNQIRVKRWDDAADYYIEFPDPAYSAYVGANPDFDTQRLRYGYTSMTTPSTVFETDMSTKDTETLKQAEVLAANLTRPTTKANASWWKRGTARWCLSRLSTARALEKRQQPLLALRIRQLRLQHGRWLLQHPLEPARPRIRLRHCPHSRWTGNGPCVVRRWEDVQQKEHLHRLRGLRTRHV